MRARALAGGGLLTALLLATVGAALTAGGGSTAGSVPYGMIATPDAAGSDRQATTVLPTVETDPSHTSGDTADDVAIWIHPSDPSLSLVIGDDKDGGLMVWGLDGKELQYIEGTNYTNLDLRYDFPLAGRFSSGTAHETVALVGVGESEHAAPGTRRDDGNSTIVVYTREGANTFRGRFKVGANGAIDAVSGTDGIDITNVSLGAGFPNGLFVIHDTANSGASASNIKYVPWESIAIALGLVVDSSYDPRAVGK